MVIGRNAVETVLANKTSRVIKLLVASDERGRAASMIQSAQRQNIEIDFRTKAELSQRASSESHQGFIAILEARTLGTRQEFLAAFENAEKFLIVALDGVTDPHNVGAILRACECFGVDAVIWSKNRSSGITPAVTKVAVGATELLSLFEVSNLAETLSVLQERTHATVACADGGDDSVDLKDFTCPAQCVLVLGSEGGGISNLISRRAGALIRVPMCGEIDSLNVSQAAAVLLYELSKGRD